MQKKSDKRQLDRTLFPSPVLIEFNDLERGSLEPLQIRGAGVDINSKGIGIIADNPIKPGGVVKLFIPLGDQKTMIPTFSEVRWSEVEDGRCRLGLKFLF